MNWRSGKVKILIVTVVVLTIFYFILPRQLFNPSYSTILEDRSGILLGARIAADGQWRFPPEGGADTLSERYVRALVLYEDKNYFRHAGVSLPSLIRAVYQNLKAGRFVSGASTITMQTISLYRGHKARNIPDKLWEVLLAIRLECRYSKDEILRLYAAHAPFGGNTVGYGAATWRYFGKHNKTLTWSEAALLAVLPNDPALIRLDKNRDDLLLKRNRLLTRMAEANLFDKADLALYLEEELPQKPYPMPDLAPHLLTTMQKISGASYLRSTVDIVLQRRVTDLLSTQGQALKGNQVHNAAICIADIRSGEVVAYVGNLPGTGPQHGGQVDVIQADRSTGSLLKPFLAMMAVQEGRMTTKSLMVDIPINIDGFKPDNFTYDYEGSIRMEDALRKSLNIPFVLLLKEYNVGRFLQRLRELGLSHLNRSAGHYGLSLIVGGGESTLWELCGAYASCARILNSYTAHSGRYDKDDVHPLMMSKNESTTEATGKDPVILDAASIYEIFQVLSENTRPGRFEGWQSVSGSGRIAWKTGTSIGFRDAWSIGVNSRYVVGVWLGNADGEGRPGVIGLETAAPLLFETFELLPPAPWFTKPYDAFRKILICGNSGYSPSEACVADTFEAPKAIQQLPSCTYDQRVALDKNGSYRVTANCYDPFEMAFENYFILPPSQQYYYARKHPLYRQVPPYRPGCIPEADMQHKVMQFIYPNNVRKLFLPRDADGTINPVTFVVAHKSAGSTVHWHLDDQYLGSTTGQHRWSTTFAAGHHILTVVDDDGNSISTSFEAKISQAGKAD